MRTRIFNKMTAQEVEDYLARGGDTIVIAMGVVEVHGACPIDCETAGAEGLAIAMADAMDGLALVNLPYFYPGGTVISNGTVHITIRDGIDYLMKICGSLADQGFKRMYLVNGHGPSLHTANAVCREFFDEYRIPMCNIGMVNLQMRAARNGWKGDLDAMMYGAYKMMGQLDFMPIDPNATESHGERIPTDPAMSKFMDLYRKYGGYGATAQIYSDPRQHGGGRIFKSREELEAVADEGIEQLRTLVQAVDFMALNAALAEYQAYVDRTCKKFPRVAPKR